MKKLLDVGVSVCGATQAQATLQMVSRNPHVEEARNAEAEHRLLHPEADDTMMPIISTRQDRITWTPSTLSGEQRPTSFAPPGRDHNNG